MEDKKFIFPPIASKYIIRTTGEEVEVIDFNLPNRGMRTEAKDLTFEEGDWVTYVDSDGKEHIKEHLNIQLDFKPVQNELLSKMLDIAKPNKIPTIRNTRIFEMAKELITNGVPSSAVVNMATQLVDNIGIETE